MSVNLLSAEPEISISGPVGSTAVLPCELASVDTDRPYIRWNTESDTVFERENEGHPYQAEGYEGRVDVPVEELHKGNCSLVLHNLKPTDSGVYTCSQRSETVTKKEISRVHLIVTNPEVNVSHPVGSTAVRPCKLSVHSNTLYIRWITESEFVLKRKNGAKYEAGGYERRVYVPVEELRKGNCSLVSCNLKPTDTGVYTCSQRVTRPKRSDTVTKKEISHVHLTVSNRTEEILCKTPCLPGTTVKTPRYRLFLIVPGLVLLGVFVWWFLRRRRRRQPRSTDTDSPL